ncbi:uncharacterized protein BO95DRAFT_193339 [Aspergillus brunneoviolaceus CBS 621.78]|uniref:Uncharacterized protein n=1 Tax=Aspergillus brunneoviolaceus CBS 621.78 TaxID=1450534 RepID=A0ACD1G3Y2_9EURO|nr:hypothetical protein BO95DRAFT_193339 [Aspergillus brunneoviolaceus CBS 621.78]RAH43978.1 hypothetical protein BO95DRAFT_193339 [Aspergillus brunneoviolaceus CBS 621.78]
MESLPPELFDAIATCLAYLDLCALRLTYKALYRATLPVFACQYFQRIHSLVTPERMAPQVHFSRLMRLHPHWVEVTLSDLALSLRSAAPSLRVVTLVALNLKENLPDSSERFRAPHGHLAELPQHS